MDEYSDTAELLNQWREATRAAELAERLATMATEAADRADRDAEVAQEIARMAERAATAAERAAHTARKAADRAVAFARDNRGGAWAEVQEAAGRTRDEETAARDKFHEAEREARRRHGQGGSG